MTIDIVAADAVRLGGYADLFARTFADDALITWPLPVGDAEDLARKRFRFGLDLAGRDGTCAFLETSRERNVGLYEHLGF
ncbi:MAG: hypothetical protein ACRDH7_16805 [Actinomycetota bacterium]